MNFILSDMHKQMHTNKIVVDLQKTFDTLDHGVLLEKMKCFGFWISIIKLFESYFSNKIFGLY